VCVCVCVCVCSGSALLRDILGVSRSRKRDLLSILSIYPRFFFCVLCIVAFYTAIMLMSIDCFGLVVSTCPSPFPFGRIGFVVLVVRKRGEGS